MIDQPTNFETETQIRMKNTRKDSLKAWLQLQFSDCRQDIKLSLISGDASFRKYYRIEVAGTNYVAVDAPPSHEDSERFIGISQLYSEASIATPSVFFKDIENGFMLLEDFGDQTYFNKLNSLKEEGNFGEINTLYESAIDTVIDIQAKVDGTSLKFYESKLLYEEMELFTNWFCDLFLGLEVDERARKLISKTFAFLTEASVCQKQVPVHRDYHSRNLMVLKEPNYHPHQKPGVIDFQDSLNGPYTYDLVSLLRDAYIRWDINYVSKWVNYYFEEAQQSALISKISRDQFIREFDLMGLQRQLKVMGIFARLSIRDNKAGYLADIPLVMDYFLEIGQKYQELEPFMLWFNDNVVDNVKVKIQRKEMLEL